LYTELQRTRADIRDYANERHSWGKVAAISEAAYRAALTGH
jgi:hypothetical protein